MLTSSHLTVLRAALQYFREELGPHGPEAWQPYLPDALATDITAQSLAELQSLLQHCQMAYVAVNLKTLRVTDPQLQLEIPAVQPAPGHQLATILWPHTIDR